MRKFSDREKEAIKRMTEGVERSNSYVLVNSYNDIFYHRKVEFHYDEDQSALVFCREKMMDISSEEILAIENDIMEVSLLIDYLMKNGLIYLIKDTPGQKKQRDIANFDNTNLPQSIQKTLDQKVASILYESMNHRIFVGYTLKDYVTNGFKTIEDLALEEAQHQTQETKNLLIEAQKQSQAATEQVREAKRQSEAASQQVQQASRLADAAELQAQEASKQTQYAQEQTSNAQQQTVYAQEQTQSARKQIKLSVIALIFSVLAIICSIMVAKFIQMDVKVDEQQVESLEKHLNAIESDIDSLRTKMQSVSSKTDKDITNKKNLKTPRRK